MNYLLAYLLMGLVVMLDQTYFNPGFMGDYRAGMEEAWEKSSHGWATNIGFAIAFSVVMVIRIVCWPWWATHYVSE